MLVATVLAAVLMSAVLTMLSGVARDRKKLNTLNTSQRAGSVIELIRWDLRNAITIASDPATHSTVLTGNGGIDAASLANNGRMVRVTYQIQSGNLWRIQEYLDDPGRPDVWAELVAGDVSEFSLDSNARAESPVPAHVRMQLAAATINVDELLWIK